MHGCTTVISCRVRGVKMCAVVGALVLVSGLVGSLRRALLSRRAVRRPDIGFVVSTVGPTVKPSQGHGSDPTVASGGPVDLATLPWFVKLPVTNLSRLTPLQFLQRETYLRRLAAESPRSSDAIAHRLGLLAPIGNGSQAATPKLILLWNSYYNQRCFGVECGARPFARCWAGRTCVLTRDRSRLAEAAAVVFHGQSIEAGDLPGPGDKPAGQKWVFFLDESAERPFSTHEVSPLIDWTMTYREDSDIYRPYGIWHPWQEDAAQTRRRLEKVHRKTKSVAWMVSNCHPATRREQYVLELRKHIDVDIYSRCPYGNARCPKSEGSRCLQMLDDTYFFYLAFENSHCRDYITEKFWQQLTIDIVPVVLGGSLRYSAETKVAADDYARVAPPPACLPTPAPYSSTSPNTSSSSAPTSSGCAPAYINARDFTTPRALANHLFRLRV